MTTVNPLLWSTEAKPGLGLGAPSGGQAELGGEAQAGKCCEAGSEGSRV